LKKRAKKLANFCNNIKSRIRFCQGAVLDYKY
jgi:hypothetical protein